MLTLSKEERERKAELERLLADCDEMLKTDCHPNGRPLTDEEYNQLWRDIRKYEDELLEIRRSKSQLTEETEKKPPIATYIFFYDCDGGMDCEPSIRHHAKDEGMEL